jgi:hypothetical protein
MGTPDLPGDLEQSKTETRSCPSSAGIRAKQTPAVKNEALQQHLWTGRNNLGAGEKEPEHQRLETQTGAHDTKRWASSLRKTRGERARAGGKSGRDRNTRAENQPRHTNPKGRKRRPNRALAAGKASAPRSTGAQQNRWETKNRQEWIGWQKRKEPVANPCARGSRKSTAETRIENKDRTGTRNKAEKRNQLAKPRDEDWH